MLLKILFQTLFVSYFRAHPLCVFLINKLLLGLEHLHSQPPSLLKIPSSLAIISKRNPHFISLRYLYRGEMYRMDRKPPDTPQQINQSIYGTYTSPLPLFLHLQLGKPLILVFPHLLHFLFIYPAFRALF